MLVIQIKTNGSAQGKVGLFYEYLRYPIFFSACYAYSIKGYRSQIFVFDRFRFLNRAIGNHIDPSHPSR